MLQQVTNNLAPHAGHRWPAERRQVHAVQPDGGLAARHRRRRARHHARPPLRRSGVGRTADLRVVDTGGIVPDDKALIPSEIFRQARVALDEADAIVLVVDGRTELASPDIESGATAAAHRQAAVAGGEQGGHAASWSRMRRSFGGSGFKELFPISAENGNGIAELLEHVLTVMPARPKMLASCRRTAGPSDSAFEVRVGMTIV